MICMAAANCVATYMKGENVSFAIRANVHRNGRVRLMVFTKLVVLVSAILRTTLCVHGHTRCACKLGWKAGRTLFWDSGHWDISYLGQRSRMSMIKDFMPVHQDCTYGGDCNRWQTLCWWSEYVRRTISLQSLSCSRGVCAFLSGSPRLGRGMTVLVSFLVDGLVILRTNLYGEEDSWRCEWPWQIYRGTSVLLK